MEHTISTYSCNTCGHEHAKAFKYCSKCGVKNFAIVKKEVKHTKLYDWHLKQLGAYSLLVLVLLAIAAFTGDTIEMLLLWTVIAAIFDFIFAVQSPSVWNLFNFKQVSIVKIALVILAFITTGVVVSIGMDLISEALNLEPGNLSHYFIGLEYPLLLGIIIIAVAPAIFEELAFRGYVFDHIKYLSGEKAAIFGSSFLFGLVHFSMISLIWIIPFGIGLAFLRKKYNTLIYGMIGHFTHNATVLIIDYYDLL